jgi:hypothetical protein
LTKGLKDICRQPLFRLFLFWLTLECDGFSLTMDRCDLQWHLVAFAINKVLFSGSREHFWILLIDMMALIFLLSTKHEVTW